MANDEVSEHMRAVARQTVITRAISTLKSRNTELSEDQLAELDEIANGRDVAPDGG